MALNCLPKELLIYIVEYSLPEGFESLTLSCQSFYTICQPYIENHNKLRRRYRYSRILDAEELHMYYPGGRATSAIKDGNLSCSIRTAFDLIKHIAFHPEAARYIEELDLESDSWPAGPSSHPQDVPKISLHGPVIELFARSPYFAEAELNWEEYYGALTNKIVQGYSQHAATFLLTLLPNVKVLRLPKLWNPSLDTTQLLNAIIRKAKQPCIFSNSASLGQVGRLGSNRADPGTQDGLDFRMHFLALPGLKHFSGHYFSGLKDFRGKRVFLASLGSYCPPYYNVWENLQTLHLMKSSADCTDMVDLLQHTPQLKSLFYSHDPRKSMNGVWSECNISRFLSVIAIHAGSHLIELSISIEGMNGVIITDDIATSDFRVLQRLKLPLQIIAPDVGKVAMCDFVPASVSELEFGVDGLDDHQRRALEILLSQFVAHKKSPAWPWWTPALQRVQFSHLAAEYESCKAQFAEVIAEAKTVGVVVEILENNGNMHWAGKWE